MSKDMDLVSKLTEEERDIAEYALKCVSPDDSKYGKASIKLNKYLSADAEWGMCAYVQRVLLETRMEFDQAEQRHLDEVEEALKKINPLNMSLLEDQITKHDQLAVIEEIGRFVSEETKSLLHPGTTSYDILDTARSYLFKEAWFEVIRPEVCKSIDKLCEIAERSINILQVGRTHLQDTSPVSFGAILAGYAARFAERLDKCDNYFKDLRGKISGIVGNGASIEMVVGMGKSLKFEKVALKKLDLKPDNTATQIVQKERLADVGHGLTTLMLVLNDLSNDIRILYSSAINEVTSRDNAERLGGSSADATKNNPVTYENICGKTVVVESGMRILYGMIQSDLQRDLRNSVMGRYQPQLMMAETYESFNRLNKALPQLSVNEDRISDNLESVRNNPSEAMVAILRGNKWVHSKYGVGHDFVKEIGKKAKKEGRSLIDIALEDEEFIKLHSEKLSDDEVAILNGELELYIGHSLERARENIKYARNFISN